MSNQEGIVKSIVYGNLIPTSYGMIRALCSSISSKDHIDKIVLYLRTNANFQKYNKFLYGFRLELESEDLFLTRQDTEQRRQKFLQGFNNDTGLEGCGEKLLALLQKFNVRNVLVIVSVRQKDPLSDFNAQHFAQIIKCAKDLLSSLYDKVILSKKENQAQEELTPEPIKIKEFQMTLQFIPTNKPTTHPNYVGKQHIAQNRVQSLAIKRGPEKRYLNEKIKELAGHLQSIIEGFSQAEDAQVRFAIKFDKNVRVVKIFSLFAKLFQLDNPNDLLKEDMSIYLKSITSRNLKSNVIRQLNNELMSDVNLKSNFMSKQNRVCGILIQFLQILLKSYGFAKRLAIIQTQIEEQKGQQRDIESPK